MKLQIFTDGGARGNPGPAGIGVVVLADGVVHYEHKAFIGLKTNNEAEYLAFLQAVTWLADEVQDQPIEQVEFFLDSQLVVEQLRRNWKIKEDRLRLFAQDIWQKLAGFTFPVTISHVHRAQNAEADRLVNQALDEAALAAS